MPTENENLEINESEKKRSKREWVKTAAIIFLAVMLVLTFFSQTIMNWSLPEVSGQYAGWGELSTGIRGSGVVTANMGYNIQIDTTRTVKQVLVRAGDHVEAGQVIFMLDESDSEELKAAKELLEQLEYDYSVKLIQTLPPDYAQTNKNIAELKEDLEKAKTDRAAIKTNEDAYNAAKAATARAQQQVDDLNDTIADLEQSLAAIESGSAENVVSSQNAYRLSEAKIALADAQASLKIAESKRDAAELDKKYPDPDTAEITAKKAALNTANNELASLTDADAIAAQKARISTLESELYTLQFGRKDQIYQQALKDVDSANILVETCTQNVLYYQNLVDKESSSYTSSLSSQLETARASLKVANANLKAAQEAEAKAQENVGLTTEQADENIKNLERQLENAIIDFQSQQKNDSVTTQLNSLEIKKAKEAIDEQQALVNKLSGEGEGAEVVTKYAGTVSELYVIAGDLAQAGQSLAAIDVEGKGYTLSITVTSEQSRMVNIGDTATVNDWWGGDIQLILSAIKTDKENAKNKILEFEIIGEPNLGQSLNITVGDRKTSYETVVPNSAIHEDSEGSFILVAEAKSTPLGNRYIAKRVNVTVIAKDNYNTAIDTGESGNYYDYVITTATKPVEAGTQVRLVEGQ